MDLVYVTYNSEQWIDKCFKTLVNSRFDLKKINIVVVDNNSSDKTVEMLKRKKEELNDFVGRFEIICADTNLGFGKGNNFGAAKGTDEIIAFFNIDTELFSDTLEQIEDEIAQSSELVAVWELRQLPYEHPKIYNPITKETNWCSGAAFVVKREVFEKVGGFDEQIFMYAEDVDLSWRIRQLGYQLHYIPKARIIHYSYQQKNEVKPKQYIYSVINNLYLRYKFGNITDIMIGHLLFWNIIRKKDTFLGARKKLLKRYFCFLKKAVLQKKNHKNSGNFKPEFIGFDYSLNRDGAFYDNKIEFNQSLVSIIVRTCGRPNVLRETLISLQNQTYSNIEIIVVEDGEETSSSMIKAEFSSLNIRYFATGKNIGRSKVGNLGMKMAKGIYLNFLDDDDVFFADHVEVLVSILESSSKKAAYATAFETPIDIISQTPYKYKVFAYKKVHTQQFDKVMLCHHNYIPIQCIMFEKDLFDLYGGFDESLDAIEDWDLWVRYSLHTEFEFVNKTTSIYRVPNNTSVNFERQKKLDVALVSVREKHKNYMQNLSVYDIAMLYEKSV